MQTMPNAKEKHTRLTKQKALLLEIFSARRGEEFTAEDIRDALDQNGTHVGLATVYRNLRAFEAAGKLIRVVAGSTASARYRYAGENPVIYSHAKVFCTACGAMAEIDKDILAKAERALCADTGFSVTDRQALFYGLCPACRAALRDSGKRR